MQRRGDRQRLQVEMAGGKGGNGIGCRWGWVAHVGSGENTREGGGEVEGVPRPVARLESVSEVVGYWGKQDVPPVYGVAHRELPDDRRRLPFAHFRGPAEEHTAVAGVHGGPAAVRREEREGEVGGEVERFGGGRGGVRRERRVEPEEVDEAEKWRSVEAAEAAEEGAAIGGDEAAEGDAGRGGAG